MSHEFLISLHSEVIGSTGEKPEVKSVQKPVEKSPKPSLARSNAVTEEERHRTVGVSMSPKLQARAAARAKEVGLSFSRYVQWCLEAEMDNAPLESRFRGRGEGAKTGGVGRGIRGILQGTGKGDAK